MNTPPRCEHRFIASKVIFCDDGPITYVACTACGARLGPTRPVEVEPPGFITTMLAPRAKG